MFKATHGMRSTHEYNIWNSMRSRCHNPKAIAYKYYGAKGIRVCDRWKKSFEHFIEDMGFRPSSKHSIDRIDSNGNYEPSNCRWATREDQARNKSNIKGITVNGQFFETLTDCAEYYNLDIKILSSRLIRGDTPEIAVRPSLGVLYNAIAVSYNGKKYESITQICKYLGISRTSLRRNIKKYKDLQKAIKQTLKNRR